MSYDITIQFILAPSTHPLTGIADASRYQEGDVIDVVPATRWAVKQGADYIAFANKGCPTFGLLHITGVPDLISIERIKSVLTSSIIGYEHVLATEQTMLRRRQVSLIRALAMPDTVATLLADREVTRSWLSVVGVLRKRVVADVYNRDADDITITLSDVDFS